MCGRSVILLFLCIAWMFSFGIPFSNLKKAYRPTVVVCKGSQFLMVVIAWLFYFSPGVVSCGEVLVSGRVLCYVKQGIGCFRLCKPISQVVLRVHLALSNHLFIHTFYVRTYLVPGSWYCSTGKVCPGDVDVEGYIRRCSIACTLTWCNKGTVCLHQKTILRRVDYCRGRSNFCFLANEESANNTESSTYFDDFSATLQERVVRTYRIHLDKTIYMAYTCSSSGSLFQHRMLGYTAVDTRGKPLSIVSVIDRETTVNSLRF